MNATPQAQLRRAAVAGRPDPGCALPARCPADDRGGRTRQRSPISSARASPTFRIARPLESFGTAHHLSRNSGRRPPRWPPGCRRRGCSKGDRVAIMLPNVMAYPAILFGVLAAGCTVVNVNPLYTARELTHQLKDPAPGCSSCSRISATRSRRPAAIWRSSAIVVVSARRSPRAQGRDRQPRLAAREEGREALHLPQAVVLPDRSGGGRARRRRSRSRSRSTTSPSCNIPAGRPASPRAPSLLHRNVAANVAQSEAWMRPFFGERPDHVMVTALPLYHIFALTVCALLMTRLGACQLLIANPRDIEGFVKTLKTRPFTLMSGVNTLYNALANHPDIERGRLLRGGAVRLRRDGDPGGRRQALEGASPASRSSRATGCRRPRRSSAPTRSTSRSSPARSAIPLPSTDVSIRDADGGVGAARASAASSASRVRR